MPLVAHVHDTSLMTPVEWVVVALSALFVAWTFWRAIRLTVSPGEEAADHVKHSILQAEGETPEIGSPAWRRARAPDAVPGPGAG